MGKYFGTDGIRGTANTGMMTPNKLLRIAQAFGVTLKTHFSRPKVLVAKDTRVSSYMIENTICAGLCSVGVDVLLAGPLPTPGVAYLTRGLRVSAGVVISASHNLYKDNGIKLFDQKGFKLPDADEDIIEQLIDAPDLEKYLVSSEFMGRAKRVDDALGQYAVFIKERFPKHLTLEGKRIVVDCANGAAYKIAPKVFSELGAEVFPIFDDPNGFNINQECGALNPEHLREKVLELRADIGIALDGDADRLVLVDELGHILNGDQIIAMCAIEMKNAGTLKNNSVCVTIMTNKGFDLAMEQAGIQVLRTGVGDRYVVEEMRLKNCILGGEQSGHLLFLDANTTGDGVIAALKVLEIMTSKSMTISELSKSMTMFPQITRNVRIYAKPPLESLSKTMNLMRKYEQELGHLGRILLRYSGTESLARITIEGPDRMRIDDMALALEKELLNEII